MSDAQRCRVAMFPRSGWPQAKEAMSMPRKRAAKAMVHYWESRDVAKQNFVGEVCSARFNMTPTPSAVARSAENTYCVRGHMSSLCAGVIAIAPSFNLAIIDKHYKHPHCVSAFDCYGCVEQILSHCVDTGHAHICSTCTL